jgi:hypothetical protein
MSEIRKVKGRKTTSLTQLFAGMAMLRLLERMAIARLMEAFLFSSFSTDIRQTRPLTTNIIFLRSTNHPLYVGGDMV